MAPAIRAFRRVHGERGDGDRAQLPVRPRRAAEESTALARGREATNAPVVLDVNGQGYGTDRELPTASQGSSVVRVLGLEDQTEARTYQILLLQNPIQNPPRDLCVMTRSVGRSDGVNAAAVWDLEMFQKAPAGSDKWIMWWNGLLVRAHGATRRRAFLPLHRSAPGATEDILPRRCTILFLGAEHLDRQIRIDNWSQTRPWQLDCLGKGYTIFDLNIGSRANLYVPTEPSESDGSYEFIEGSWAHLRLVQSTKGECEYSMEHQS